MQAVTILGLAIGVAACGGGSTSGAPKAPPTTESASQRATDQARAQHDVLVRADFPAGWSATPHKSATSDQAIAAHIGACLQVDPAVVEANPDTPSANGPDFSSGRAQVSNTVAIEPSASIAARQFSALARTDPTRCLAQALSSAVQHQLKTTAGSAPAGLSINNIRAAKLVFPHVGDDTDAYRVRFQISVQGLQISYVSDAVLIRKGRTEAGVEFSGTGQPQSSAFEDQLGRALAGRLG